MNTQQPLAIPLVFAGALLVASGSSHALKPENITPAEMALIPKYCPDTNTFGYGGTADNQSPNAPKWIALMGKGFYAVHHYCWASIALLRAERPTVPRMEKQAAWKGALNDMQYVIDNSPANFVLLPEIYTKMGEVALKLNSPREAEGYLTKAVTLKRDYWPAYFRWGEYLKGAGQNAEAKRVTEEGLSYAPDAKALQALFKALGGDPRTVVRKSVAQDPGAPGEAVAAGTQSGLATKPQ